MSGGSFNHLYRLGIAELLSEVTSVGDDLAEMARTLTELGVHDAAAEAEFIIADVAAFKRRTEVRLNRLRYLFKTVEWKVSGDGSIEAVHEAVARYRGMRP